MNKSQKEKTFFLETFFAMESSSGIMLILGAVLAIILANTALEPFYQSFLILPVEFHIGSFAINKPLQLWINDGLMAIFFFVIGLELKREIIEGELADRRNVILPGVGALGGMLIPALIYTAFNYNDSYAMRGWAIPAATDIAFTLGVLSLLGSRVPISIKVFLTSLAIFDDIGAIIIIAVFYTSNISITALIVVLVCATVLFAMNQLGIIKRSAYVVVGLVMWAATLKSGVHATLAGFLLALFIPMGNGQCPSPLKTFEHDLHGIVAFLILPIFAFANAGLNVSNMDADQIFHSVPVGITLGLVIGKQVGIFSFVWLSIKMGLTKLPSGMNMLALYGSSALCGIGFTMSLFIGSLAFTDISASAAFDERLGIIVGSLISAIIGFWALWFALNNKKKAD